MPGEQKKSVDEILAAVRQPDAAGSKPDKPAEAGTTARRAVDRGRRVFILGTLFGTPMRAGFTALTATIAAWLLATVRFMFANTIATPPSRFKVGLPADFPPGVVDTRFKARHHIWIVNHRYKGQRQIFALSTVCTHLGCTPNWLEGEQKFKCPCHGTGFYKDGTNFEGPAPRPLERYAIRIADDGRLEVDTGKTFQQELGQWEDPDSFVAV